MKHAQVIKRRLVTTDNYIGMRMESLTGEKQGAVHHRCMASFRRGGSV